MTTSARRKMPPLVRLLPLIKRDTDTGCWNFTGYITPAGYGQFFDGEHRNAFAHRVVYEQTRGIIPPGKHLDHLCRNRKCCNPFHVEVVTCQENFARGNGFVGVNLRVEKCPRGHVYDEANTYHRPNGNGRDCKKCRAIRQRAKGARVYEQADALRDVKLVRGWTRDEIAAYVGLGEGAVHHIEDGRKSEADPEVFALLDALIDEFNAETAPIPNVASARPTLSDPLGGAS